jgi:hypothetical protein
MPDVDPRLALNVIQRSPFKSDPSQEYLKRIKTDYDRFGASGNNFNSFMNPQRRETQDAGIQNTPFKGFQNPNEHFSAQQSLLAGGAPQTRTDPLNMEGIQERDMRTAEMGDIATQKAEEEANRRRSQQNALMDSFGSEGFDTGEFAGDGGDSGLSGEQLQNARLIANVGRSRGLGEKEIQIALMTALAESGLRNLNYGDRDSVGLFQQRTSQGWGSIPQIMDPNYSAGKFYDALRGINYGGMNPWQAAQTVQRSFDPTGSNYKAQYQKAIQAYNSLSGGGSNPNGAGASGVANPQLAKWMQAHNNRYLDYDNAYGAQCVDMYSYYTTGFVGGKPLPVGYAGEIFNNYDRSVYTRFGSNSVGRAGDVAIWQPGGYTPLGHVAIVVGDNGNGTLRVLHSNATSAGSRGNSIISNISKAALSGYLRPNKLMGR